MFSAVVSGMPSKPYSKPEMNGSVTQTHTQIYCNAWMSDTLSPLSKICPNSLRFSSTVLVACFTSTASSMTRFMNSSNPLIFPSIRMANCSNNQIDTVECCCKSLKMKLIGGNSTFPLPPPPRPVICPSGSMGVGRLYYQLQWIDPSKYFPV